MEQETKGIVFDISHYMLEDGPGIRTNVFLKGCYLKCLWCSNVYGLKPQIQMSFIQKKCSGCRACESICPAGAISFGEDGLAQTDFSKCTRCMKCTEVCRNKAREQVGKEMTVGEVLKEVEKDRSFYRHGGGGLTLSGGEILMQGMFAAEILKRAQRRGIHTAIETSGCGKWEDLKEILRHCDLAFMDCKCMDREQHKKLTGVYNDSILQNIKNATAFCFEQGTRLVVRLPLIPGLNDSRENVSATADFVHSLEGAPELNILPYHNFGSMKYEYVGETYTLDHIKVQEIKELEWIKTLCDEKGVPCGIGGYNI